LKKNIDVLDYLIKRRYGSGQGHALKLILDGAVGQLPLDDMVKNWWLEGKDLKGYNYKWEVHSSATNCCVATSRLKERE
jgi:hypothetical protein